jgi:5-formyltetrahydrofolate cyclo-ligase
MGIAACGHGTAAVEFEPGTIISGFLPIRSEIDPRPLLENLHSRGARLCLPAIIDRATIVFRELVRGQNLTDTGFGTIGPGQDADILDPEILIMPLAAFDRHGNRIGYGAGHYDRAIARLEAKGMAPACIGIAFSIQEVDRVPAMPYDKRMHAVITEAGHRRFVPQQE